MGNSKLGLLLKQSVLQIQPIFRINFTVIFQCILTKNANRELRWKSLHSFRWAKRNRHKINYLTFVSKDKSVFFGRPIFTSMGYAVKEKHWFYVVSTRSLMLTLLCYLFFIAGSQRLLCLASQYSLYVEQILQCEQMEVFLLRG